MRSCVMKSGGGGYSNRRIGHYIPAIRKVYVDGSIGPYAHHLAANSFNAVPNAAYKVHRAYGLTFATHCLELMTDALYGITGQSSGGVVHLFGEQFGTASGCRPDRWRSVRPAHA